ncbi:MAG: hypothetical protein AB7I96_00180 [Candidatus Dadabacteria bacterium]
MRTTGKKVLAALLLFLALASCDGGGNKGTNEDSCNRFFMPFTPIPECVTDYLLENWTACTCAGEESEFDLLLQSVEVDGFNGYLSGSGINWELLSCTSISFTGEASGVLENMTVPDVRTLKFTITLEGSEPEQASCCCTIALVVD